MISERWHIAYPFVIEKTFTSPTLLGTRIPHTVTRGTTFSLCMFSLFYFSYAQSYKLVAFSLLVCLYLFPTAFCVPSSSGPLFVHLVHIVARFWRHPVVKNCYRSCLDFYYTSPRCDNAFSLPLFVTDVAFTVPSFIGKTLFIYLCLFRIDFYYT